MKRAVLPLDGPWFFQIDRDEQGEARDWHKPDYRSDTWMEVEVPGNWDTYLDGLFGFAGHTWYRHTFSIDPGWKGARVHLSFEGANYETTAWLNGQAVGLHRGGFDPFEFDVTEVLNWDGENLLAVRVDNWPKLNRVPNSLTGWWNYGGIYRSVKLLTLPPVWIDDIFVRAEPEQDSADVPLVVEITVASQEKEQVEVALTATVSQDSELIQLIGELAAPAKTLAPGQAVHMALTAVIPEARLWSPEEPNLYSLHVSLQRGDTVLDAQDVTFGARKFEVSGTKFYFNGGPITLTGFNRHEEYAGSGRVAPKIALEDDLQLIKEMNGNTVRMHYQAHPDLYDLCDRMGLLVFAEIPLWQVGVKDLAEWDAPEVRETAETMLRTLVRSLRNHPCVVVWSVGNECATNREEARPLIRDLADLARSLDASRPIAYVTMYGREEKCFGLVDIPCINVYYGQNTTALEEYIDAVHALTADKPLMITEFGHEAVHGLHGEGYGTEDEQALVLEQKWQVFRQRRDFISGALIWCLADYWHMPMGPDFRWLNRLYFCHGVATLDRKPKMAMDTVKRMFGQSK